MRRSCSRGWCPSIATGTRYSSNDCGGSQARDAKHFLVFDEADSLLGDRRFAERLDPATLRRFDFKIALDYLTPEQAGAAFRRYFDLTPPAGIDELGALAPGDCPLAMPFGAGT